MRKVLGILIFVVTLLVPPQIVPAAKPTHEDVVNEMNYQIIQRMTSTEMKMGEAMMKVMKMRQSKEMSKEKMEKLMKMLDRIDQEINAILKGLDE